MRWGVWQEACGQWIHPSVWQLRLRGQKEGRENDTMLLLSMYGSGKCRGTPPSAILQISSEFLMSYVI